MDEAGPVLIMTLTLIVIGDPSFSSSFSLSFSGLAPGKKEKEKAGPRDANRWPVNWGQHEPSWPASPAR